MLSIDFISPTLLRLLTYVQYFLEIPRYVVIETANGDHSQLSSHELSAAAHEVLDGRLLSVFQRLFENVAPAAIRRARRTVAQLTPQTPVLLRVKCNGSSMASAMGYTVYFTENTHSTQLQVFVPFHDLYDIANNAAIPASPREKYLTRIIITNAALIRAVFSGNCTAPHNPYAVCEKFIRHLTLRLEDVRSGCDGLITVLEAHSKLNHITPDMKAKIAEKVGAIQEHARHAVYDPLPSDHTSGQVQEVMWHIIFNLFSVNLQRLSEWQEKWAEAEKAADAMRTALTEAQLGTASLQLQLNTEQLTVTEQRHNVQKLVAAIEEKENEVADALQRIKMCEEKYNVVLAAKEKIEKDAQASKTLAHRNETLAQAHIASVGTDLLQCRQERGECVSRLRDVASENGELKKRLNALASATLNGNHVPHSNSHTLQQNQPWFGDNVANFIPLAVHRSFMDDLNTQIEELHTTVAAQQKTIQNLSSELSERAQAYNNLHAHYTDMREKLETINVAKAKAESNLERCTESLDETHATQVQSEEGTPPHRAQYVIDALRQECARLDAQVRAERTGREQAEHALREAFHHANTSLPVGVGSEHAESSGVSIPVVLTQGVTTGLRTGKRMRFLTEGSGPPERGASEPGTPHTASVVPVEAVTRVTQMLSSAQCEASALRERCDQLSALCAQEASSRQDMEAERNTALARAEQMENLANELKTTVSDAKGVAAKLQVPQPKMPDDHQHDDATSDRRTLTIYGQQIRAMSDAIATFVAVAKKYDHPSARVGSQTVADATAALGKLSMAGESARSVVGAGPAAAYILLDEHVGKVMALQNALRSSENAERRARTAAEDAENNLQKMRSTILKVAKIKRECSECKTRAREAPLQDSPVRRVARKFTIAPDSSDEFLSAGTNDSGGEKLEMDDDYLRNPKKIPCSATEETLAATVTHLSNQLQSVKDEHEAQLLTNADWYLAYQHALNVAVRELYVHMRQREKNPEKVPFSKLTRLVNALAKRTTVPPPGGATPTDAPESSLSAGLSSSDSDQDAEDRSPKRFDSKMRAMNAASVLATTRPPHELYAKALKHAKDQVKNLNRIVTRKDTELAKHRQEREAHAKYVRLAEGTTERLEEETEKLGSLVADMTTAAASKDTQIQTLSSALHSLEFKKEQLEHDLAKQANALVALQASAHEGHNKALCVGRDEYIAQASGIVMNMLKKFDPSFSPDRENLLENLRRLDNAFSNERTDYFSALTKDLLEPISATLIAVSNKMGIVLNGGQSAQEIAQNMLDIATRMEKDNNDAAQHYELQLEATVQKINNHTEVLLRNIAQATYGPHAYTDECERVARFDDLPKIHLHLSHNDALIADDMFLIKKECNGMNAKLRSIIERLEQEKLDLQNEFHMSPHGART